MTFGFAVRNDADHVSLCYLWQTIWGHEEVTQEGLDQRGAPAGMNPPRQTVSNAGIKIVGFPVWLLNVK